MNFTYENQGTSTFLVYAIEESDQLDSISVGMITNNSIPGLVKAVFTQMDTSKFIKYNVSSKIPVKQFFTGPVNKKRLLGVLQGIVDAMLSAEEYMIDPNMILVDTDYMYADVSTCETTLICLPVIRAGAQSADLIAFFKDIMFSTQFDQTENCDYVAKIINYLNSAHAFSAERFKALLAEIAQKAAPVSTPEKPLQRPVVASAPKPSPAKAPQRPPEPRPASIPTPPPQNVPPAKPVQPTPIQRPVSQPAVVPGGSEKEISLFYLLQHYNKENATIYKAQKERKKAQKAGDTASKKTASPKQKTPSYAVPGQPATPMTPPPPATPAAPVAANPVASAQRPTPYSPPSAPAASVATGKMGAVPPISPGHPQAPDMFGDFGGTVYFGEEYQEDSATVIMGQEKATQQLLPHLLRKRNSEKIPINKPIFRLGRDVEFNDYAIIDNVYIGHSHCHIVSRDGEYFVVDDNSKNHTLVNGTSIPSGQEVKLAHGYILSVANEEFEFKLY